MRDSIKRDSGVGEGRGEKSHGRLRVSEAMNPGEKKAHMFT